MIDQDTPSGTPVNVVEDDGTTTETTTRSLPWRLGSGALVVLLEGRTGGYSAERCTVRDPSDPRPHPEFNRGFAAGRESAAALADSEAVDWKVTATHEPGSSTSAWQRAVDKQNALSGLARHIREGRGR